MNPIADITTLLSAFTIPTGICDDKGNWLAMSERLQPLLSQQGCSELRHLFADESLWPDAWREVRRNRKSSLHRIALTDPMSAFVVCGKRLDFTTGTAYLIEFRPRPHTQSPHAQLQAMFREHEQSKLKRLTDAKKVTRAVTQSYTDQLTRIPNRRAFDVYMEKRWRRAINDRASLALLVVDIDLFKDVNDVWGHAHGDQLLIAVAKCINATVTRRSDMVGRIGGEEFAVLLPNTDAPGARIVAQRLVDAVQALCLPHPTRQVADHVTISVGAASTKPSPRENAKDLFKHADEALYNAKNAGRNCMRQYAIDPVPVVRIVQDNTKKLALQDGRTSGRLLSPCGSGFSRDSTPTIAAEVAPKAAVQFSQSLGR